MKKRIIGLVFVLSLTLTSFISCGNDSKVDEVNGSKEEQNIVKQFEEEKIVIKTADIKNLNSKKLTETLNAKEGEQGIFCFTVTDTADATKKMDYLLFNGVDKGFKDFDFNLEKNVMKINVSYDPSAESKQSLYLIEKDASISFDSIEVTLTKEDGSVTIYEF